MEDEILRPSGVALQVAALLASVRADAELTGVSEAIVALSDEERKRLQELEQDLAQDSPHLADPFRADSFRAGSRPADSFRTESPPPGPMPEGTTPGRGFGGFVVGIIGVLILLLGAAGGATGAGVFGFIVMAAGVFLALRSRRSGGA